MKIFDFIFVFILFEGLELPILFIIRGVPGGNIDKGEFEEYPDGHFYAVQESA